MFDASYRNRALFTDFYELTMVNGYFQNNRHSIVTSFELFFRSNPFKGGFAIVSGIYDALKFLSNFSFTESDIDYLSSLKMFSEPFLSYLQSLRLDNHCEILGMKEGSIAFPYEPIFQVTAPLGFAQLIETALLNIINYQTLIATKAARINLATKRKENVMEFGLRRAQGDGGIVGSKATIIGGCVATSNTLAGKIYGLPVRGTHAHSWIQSFKTELEAFRAYAKVFPKNTILLVDTYNVLKSGVPNAIIIGKEMKENGNSLSGIRIDSGDLAWLTLESARMLDDAGLTDVKIILSSDLDEYLIESIVNQILSDNNTYLEKEFRERTINRILWGVGTNLITGSGNNQAALGGVYKMVEVENEPVIKISENRAKTTDPGRKQVYRVKDQKDSLIADVMTFYSEPVPKEGDTIYHRTDPTKYFTLEICSANPLLIDIQEYYKQFGKNEKDIWKDSKERCRLELSSIDKSHLRFLNPHIYKVSLSKPLYKKKQAFLDQKS